jgi:chromate transporter
VAAAVLDAVNVASLALMAVAGWHLARAAVVDVASGMIGVAAAALLIRWRVNSVWLVLGGALLGVALRAMRGG